MKVKVPHSASPCARNGVPSGSWTSGGCIASIATWWPFHANLHAYLHHPQGYHHWMPPSTPLSVFQTYHYPPLSSCVILRFLCSTRYPRHFSSESQFGNPSWREPENRLGRSMEVGDRAPVREPVVAGFGELPRDGRRRCSRLKSHHLQCG